MSKITISKNNNNNNLLGYYPFNGNADNIQGNNNGIVTNTVLTTDRFGNENSAYLFNGINSLIDLDDVYDIEPTGFSISVWVYINSFVRSDIIQKQRQSIPFDGWFLRIVQNGTQNINFAIIKDSNTGDDHYLRIYTNDILSLNTWHHIVVTVDSNFNVTGSKIYVDGISQTINNTGDNLTVLPNNEIKTTIGAAYDNDLNFDGKIDDILIYNKSLTQEEVTNLYNNKVGFNYIKLKHSYNTYSYYKLNGDYIDFISKINGTGIDSTFTNDRNNNSNSAWMKTTNNGRVEIPYNEKHSIYNDFSVNLWASKTNIIDSGWKGTIICRWNTGASSGTNEWVWEYLVELMIIIKLFQ